jgi:hypothetical protein
LHFCSSACNGIRPENEEEPVNNTKILKRLCREITRDFFLTRILDFTMGREHEYLAIKPASLIFGQVGVALAELPAQFLKSLPRSMMVKYMFTR